MKHLEGHELEQYLELFRLMRESESTPRKAEMFGLKWLSQVQKASLWSALHHSALGYRVAWGFDSRDRFTSGVVWHLEETKPVETWLIGMGQKYPDRESRAWILEKVREIPWDVQKFRKALRSFWMGARSVEIPPAVRSLVEEKIGDPVGAVYTQEAWTKPRCRKALLGCTLLIKEEPESLASIRASVAK